MIFGILASVGDDTPTIPSEGDDAPALPSAGGASPAIPSVGRDAHIAPFSNTMIISTGDGSLYSHMPQNSQFIHCPFIVT